MIRKGYHCAYDTHYHIVFPVKYRKALLRNEVTVYIKEISKELELRYDFEIEQLGCDKDHIHILCSFHPKYAGGDFVRLYKSIVAKELFKKFPDLKKELWGGEFWSDGYYLATVSERGNWHIVQQYVKNQSKEGKTIPSTQLRLL